jgi:hypothetical protein
MWRPRHDEGVKLLIEERRIISRDDYRHLFSYGIYHTTIDPGLETFMDAIRPETYSSQKEARGLFDATKRTHIAFWNAHEEKLTYLRRLKCKKLLTGDERVAERFAYSKFFDTLAGGERSANRVDGLLASLDDKRLEVSLHAVAKARVPTKFKQKPTGGGNPSQGNKGNPTRGKLKNKGPAPIKGKPEAKLVKPKPRPYLKAEVEHETLG